MIRQFELVEKVKSYDPQADEDALNSAYVFAMKAHGSQMRESGDLYFSHPLEVAGILTDMKLDTASIITALLHDTVEDTEATLDDIEKLFGKEVAKLVDGVTKLSQIELQTIQRKQAENFRKLVLAMSNDLRVLLIKLADRLHNMRTLHYCKAEEKRRRISRETMDIYAPLAGRIGVNHIKDELEDLSFRHLNPDARDSIITRLRFLREEDEDTVGFVMGELKKIINKSGLKVDISGREKTPYSIWRKMSKKNVTFEQLSDIMAFRLLVDNLEDCYQAMGVIHAAYPVIPGSFKDYISTPKPNNYQSIHTTVFGPNGQRVEIQIRTKQMHEVNEFGVAAHWKYKQDVEASDDSQGYRWLRGLLDILENAQDPEEFLEHTKMEMFQDQVFCFTPKGDLIPLPSGATPIDFAYAVHSEVGNHCVGAKINGRMEPLRTVLKNGDQVDITTSKAQSPSPTWERFAVTGKARASIRRFIRTQKRNQFVDLGHSMLHKGFKHENLVLHEKELEKNLEKLGCKELDDLYATIGEGLKTVPEVIRVLYPDHVPAKKDPAIIPSTQAKKKGDYDKSISIQGLIPGMAVHYAGCCHPLPGDRIVGIVISGRGVTIHTHDCSNLERFADQPDRWLDVSWNDQHYNDQLYVARLKVTVLNKVGSLANLTTLIGKNAGNIINLKIVHRSEVFWDVVIDVEVNDREHLNSIVASMRSSTFINAVDISNS
ncbi:MAG: RelA/SpoT family protein [Alphaproteobacteria bacterium]